MPVSLPFTAADIRLAAGDRSYERGLEYIDAVEDLEISDTEVTASVYGSSEYTVCLAIGDQRLSGSCTCPYGRDGFFCKHCVAVGLFVLEMGEDLPRHVEATRVQQQALEAWLQSLSKEELLTELRGLINDDRELRQRFELRAAAKDAASERQWLCLADASIDSHPADALAVYRTTIGALKTQTGDDNYRRIASLLLSAQACHQALGTANEFTRYVAALRAEQKRKRNLMKILDQNGL